MCMSAPKVQAAPIQQAPRQVVSQAVEAQDKPIELVTADKDVKKKKKLAWTQMIGKNLRIWERMYSAICLTT